MLNGSEHIGASSFSIFLGAKSEDLTRWGICRTLVKSENKERENIEDAQKKLLQKSLVCLDRCHLHRSFPLRSRPVQDPQGQVIRIEATSHEYNVSKWDGTILFSKTFFPQDTWARDSERKHNVQDGKLGKRNETDFLTFWADCQFYHQPFLSIVVS